MEFKCKDFFQRIPSFCNLKGFCDKKAWYKDDGSMETPMFSLEDKEFEAKVVKIYDGDTIHVVFPFKGEITRWKIRMEGYDSPEIRSKNSEEKMAAQVAKQALADKIDNNKVRLVCGKFDKYGRLLGTIFLGDDNINMWMISQGYGYPYEGGTKMIFEPPAVVIG